MASLISKCRRTVTKGLTSSRDWEPEAGVFWLLLWQNITHNLTGALLRKLPSPRCQFCGRMPHSSRRLSFVYCRTSGLRSSVAQSVLVWFFCLASVQAGGHITRHFIHVTPDLMCRVLSSAALTLPRLSLREELDWLPNVVSARLNFCWHSLFSLWFFSKPDRDLSYVRLQFLEVAITCEATVVLGLHGENVTRWKIGLQRDPAQYRTLPRKLLHN